MALVIIMMSAMPKLCGVNIYLLEDQRSLASGFLSVKAKVSVGELRIRETSANYPRSVFLHSAVQLPRTIGGSLGL
jgi:hypothetical protein